MHAANPVVSNTTPLITLGEVELLDSLHLIYGEIWIPQAVFDEYQRGLVAHPQRPDVQGLVWVTVHPVLPDPLVPLSLDLGEREAIALARAHQARLVLIDERQARGVAMRLQ